MEVEPLITVDEAKSWTRIDDDADDAILASLVQAASEQACLYTGVEWQAADCPDTLRRAVALMVADLYANREGQIVGRRAWEALLNPFRASVL